MEVILPALVVVVMVVVETERGRSVRRVGLLVVVVVGVCAGGEAAGAGWDRTGPGACAGGLEERTPLLAARTRQGGAEVTLLAAQSGRRGRGWRVALARPLRVRDCGGRG